MELCIERYWKVPGGFSIGVTSDHLRLPSHNRFRGSTYVDKWSVNHHHLHHRCFKLGISKLPLQITAKLYVADGAKRCIDRHREGMSQLSIIRCYFPPANKTITHYHVVHMVVVNKCLKIFSGFALCLPAGKSVRHIGGLCPTICGLLLLSSRMSRCCFLLWVNGAKYEFGVQIAEGHVFDIYSSIFSIS